ncbi:diketogulonate reductase-like aldo/keto reductase [Natranaerovirga hydrolytica]|uniref:Diketogulonate reductase-like aldo/keto reductase n=1 Tax=Natranaerovirga hydrolytica TaxID=680378 RepID=A0A4R1M7V5_9FIRM|nr:aldo/keto reductase [Natranaerovirga hydrolytica]TCK88015.1 diketogulonate reductase-like aldo/keto reductase [Natranaerovirga hydrolytica]
MNSLTDTFTLHNGVKIPCIGFGTWQTPDGKTAVQSVKDALELGYRHIDTAAAYGNEESIGKGIKESGIKREEIFVTSKLQNPEHGYESTLAAFEETMKRLDLECLDLYLIHWPNPIKFRDHWEEANAGTWKAFEELYEAGRIKSIGISNFRPHHIDALLKTAKIVPMVNQIKLCPGETQPETVEYCRKNNILLEAYSPLGTGKVFEVEEMKALAQKYNKTIAQICVRWCLENEYLPLPKSVHKSRIEENARVFDFKLSQEDVDLIANLTGCCGKTHDPDKTNF